MPKVYAKTKMPKGCPDGRKKKIAVGFYPDLFKRIKGIAVTNGHSFTHQVNLLCEAGMRK